MLTWLNRDRSNRRGGNEREKKGEIILLLGLPNILAL